MMTVKIKTNHSRRFTIPVPYGFLYVFSSLLSSKILWRQVDMWIRHRLGRTDFSIAPLDATVIKRFLSVVITELKQQRGLVIVDVTLQDGTQVMIRL